MYIRSYTLVPCKCRVSLRCPAIKQERPVFQLSLAEMQNFDVSPCSERFNEFQAVAQGLGEFHTFLWVTCL